MAATYLEMPSPSLFSASHCPVLWIVVERVILPQANPQAVLLAGIVTLVDEMTLVGIGIVFVDKGLDSTVPSLGLEGAAFAQTQVD